MSQVFHGCARGGMLSRRALTVAAVLATAVVTTAPSAQAIVLSTFTDPHPTVSGGTIGFAYAGNKFVGSVQGDGLNILYSTDLTGGSVALFAPTISVAAGTASSEHFVASSLGLGGFPNRDIYVAAGPSGILHINNAGTVGSTFVSGMSGSVRGILFDAVGTFGNDMLVTTTTGNIYRINSLGHFVNTAGADVGLVVTAIASVGEDTEGLDIAPLGNGFSVFDGQLIVASEGSGRVRAITPGGVVSDVLGGSSGFPGITGAEELTFIPLNLGISGNPVEGFYGANYTPNVVKAGVGQFTAGMLGDILVTGETTGIITDVHWDSVNSIFVLTNIGSFPNQPEDGIFVTAAIITGGGQDGIPEPMTAQLGVASLAALGLVLLRRRSPMHPVRA